MNDVSTRSGKPALESFYPHGVHGRVFLPQFPIQSNVISKLALNYLKFSVSRSGADVPWQFDVHNPPVQAVFSWCSNLESKMIVTLVYDTSRWVISSKRPYEVPSLSDHLLLQPSTGLDVDVLW